MIGTNVPRKEGIPKVTGAALYIDDMVFDELLHGATIRSTVPHGTLVDVHFEGDLPWDEFVVVRASDVPGDNVVTMIESDQPFLADGRIMHAGEAVVLIAHADKDLVARARKHVRLEITPLEPVLSIADSVAKKATLYAKDNAFKRFLVEKGSTKDAFKADGLTIVEGEYTTGAQEQLYIEPNGMVAIASEKEGVTIWGSLQCPYYVHKALVPLFGLGADNVRIVQATTGGGFGGKEEFPSIIAGHAALLSWKAGGKPVKLIYDRAEDMWVTTKRHPSITRHKTAIDAKGKLVAMEVDFRIDGGAYATLSSVVLSRGTIHACGPYACPNQRITAAAMATNHPPHGAFRGFGAPQSIFGLERHLDRCAAAVGLTPDEFRRRNLLKPGQTTATHQVIEEKIDLPAMLDLALKRSDWAKKREAFEVENAKEGARIKRGIGLASFFHGSGFTGSGEVYLASVVGVRARQGGTIEILASSTEIGQGTNTIFAQIASEALNIPYEWIQIANPDTANVPDSGPTVASRTCMVVGKLVERGCRQLVDALRKGGFLAGDGYDAKQFARACDAYIFRHGKLEATTTYTPPPGVEWDEKRYRGSAYAAYGWAVYVAEVSVDMLTWEARVEHFTAVQDIGKVIHPVLAAGQVEGGVTQGIGFALYEDVVWRDGSMINNQMTNYIIPTAADVPPIDVVFHEVPFAHGPSGAKGVGELPMDGPAPAILNAIEHATGLSITSLPAAPEVIMAAALKNAAEATHG